MLDPAEVKRKAIEALASDSLLGSRLFFKGGSLLELVYGIGLRSSIDLDYSIDGDFLASELLEIPDRVSRRLTAGFAPLNVRVFDVRFTPRPAEVSAELSPFWGGYRVEFKIISTARATALGADVEAMRREAIAVGPGFQRTLEIDISKHEHCGEHEVLRIGNERLLTYSPRLVVAEKLRAICQQMPEYRAVVRSRGARPRARDFFDIALLVERFSLALATPEFRVLLGRVFEAKRVAIELLWRVETTREFHRPDFESVLATVPAGIEVLGFDEYFDAVGLEIERLKPLWNQ